jgi:predicted AlkP superfamily pyrophosphatase or phosphodiesterase
LSKPILTIRGLIKRREEYDIILTSDHGMTEVSNDRVIFIDQILKESMKDVTFYQLGMLSDNRTSNFQKLALIEPRDQSDLERIYKILNNSHPNMKVWKKKDFPTHFHYKLINRVPSIICLADLQYSIGIKSLNQNMTTKGAHGYDNRENDMKGVFIANGPSFKNDYVMENPMEAFQVYNILSHLLNIKPSPNNGTLNTVRHIFK